MEQKHIYLSALGVGVGVGVGLGLGSGQGISKWSSIGAARNSSDFAGANADEIELELRRLLVDGKESSVTFDDFPYYIRYTLSHLLINL